MITLFSQILSDNITTGGNSLYFVKLHLCYLSSEVPNGCVLYLNARERIRMREIFQRYEHVLIKRNVCVNTAN